MHFFYADRHIYVYLSLLFNSSMYHGYLPEEFMKTAIVIIIKRKNGNSSDKNNYRPIALVTACSKIFELCLLEISKQIRTLYIRSNKLLRMFSYCTIDVKNELFRSYCSSLYCCAL